MRKYEQMLGIAQKDPKASKHKKKKVQGGVIRRYLGLTLGMGRLRSQEPF